MKDEFGQGCNRPCAVLKVRNGNHDDLYINELPGRPMSLIAVLCITAHN